MMTLKVLDAKSLGIFVPYEIAQILKEKQFDVPCMAIFKGDQSFNFKYKEQSPFTNNMHQLKNSFIGKTKCTAPTYEQVIGWFENTHNKFIYAFRYGNVWQWKIDTEHGCDEFSRGEGYNSKQEALDAVLKKALTLIP